MKALTAISIAVGVLAGSLAQAASTSSQFHLEKDARIADLGLAPQGEVRSVTLSLAVKNLAAMEAYAASTVDPASPNYHQFLTPEQVGAQYGQDAVSIAQVVNFLQSQGLTITKVYSNNLLINARGTNAQLAAVFGSPIHTFRSQGQTYEAPSGSSAVPTQLVGLVKGVHGLSARPVIGSRARHQPRAIEALAGATTGVIPTPQAAATTKPGSYTVADLAQLYNVTPLYSAGMTGAGKTIGIVTLAGYRKSDVFAYWNAVGLNVDPNRITDVPVDGGSGPDANGADETTLDVEQSGGVAPGAKMRVYIAPNTFDSFINAFATAVTENKVDTLSVSWGAPEIALGDTQDAFHTVFLQAAVQGIPVIAASGDAGAFDINSSYAYPGCTNLLSVDYPAADPLVLAAGGTTLPIKLNSQISVTAERAWGADYLRSFVVGTYGNSVYYNEFYPQGGGGGVSVNWGRPSYQNNLAGVANSAAGQSLLCTNASLGASGSGFQDLIDMPSSYAGRNLPDVSMNADPYSGYMLYFNGAWASGWGGTSYVAPQLNGIFTLIAAAKGGRLGLLQPQLYSTFKAKGYAAGSPFRPITSGTNLNYASKANYNPATGLGTLDVANLARSFGVSL